MKTKLLILLLSLLMLSNCLLSQLLNTEPLAAYQIDKEWYVIDKYGKTLYSSKEILDVYKYSEGLLSGYAMHGTDVVSAYYDNNGKLMVATPSTTPFPFQDGIAFILYQKDADSKEYLLGATNKYGKMIIPIEYIDIEPFSEGLAYVMNDKHRGFVDTTGKFVFYLDNGWSGYGFSEGLSPVSNSKIEKFGYVNKKGEQVIDMNFEEASKFSNGLARVFFQNENDDGHFGYINKKGIVVISGKYENATHFKEDRAFVAITDMEDVNFLYALMDKDGMFLTSFDFLQERDFSDGVAAVQCEDRLWRHIDKNGKFINSMGYKIAYSYSNDLAFVITQDGQKQFVDKSGKVIVKLPDSTISVLDCRTNEKMIDKW